MGSHRAFLRSKAVSQSVQTEAIDLFVVFLQKKTHLADPLPDHSYLPNRSKNPAPILPFNNSTEPPMPKNKVSDLITDQEIAFARLVLSGTMTDRRAAQAVGLNPDTAAYTKSKPRVRAYMIEHRAAVQQQLVEQETEGLRRLNLGREQVLARLWEIANLGPEITRGSITGQVKALSMIVAMQSLIPDRRAGSSEKQSTPPPTHPDSMPPPGLASSREKPSTPSQALHLPRKKTGLTSPSPNPLPARRDTRLRPPA
jgi:hypothetical protein